MKICETFSGNSLKEDLLIDSTFDPFYFLGDNPFKDIGKWVVTVSTYGTGKQMTN